MTKESNALNERMVESIARAIKSLHSNMVADDQDFGLSLTLPRTSSSVAPRGFQVPGRALLPDPEHFPAVPCKACSGVRHASGELLDASGKPCFTWGGSAILGDSLQAMPFWGSSFETAGGRMRQRSSEVTKWRTMRKLCLLTEVQKEYASGTESCVARVVWEEIHSEALQLQVLYSLESAFVAPEENVPNLGSVFRGTVDRSSLIESMITLKAVLLILECGPEGTSVVLIFHPRVKTSRLESIYGVSTPFWRVGQVLVKVRAGHAWLTSSEWNTLMHIIYGNTVTTTKTVTKTTTEENTPPGTPTKPVPKPAAKPKPKPANKPPKAPKPAPPKKGATMELSGYFGPAWGFPDDPETAVDLLIGKWGRKDTNIVLTIKDHMKKVQDVQNGLGTQFADDLTNEHMEFLTNTATLFQEYIDGQLQNTIGGGSADPASDDEENLAEAMFPGVAAEQSGKDMYVYNKPDPKDANPRFPTCTVPKLGNNAGAEAYRVWRLQLLAWLESCSEQRYLEGSVRNAMMSALSEDLSKQITNFFNTDLGKTSVGRVLVYLDQKHALVSETEKKRAIKEFRDFYRTSSMSLMNFLVQYRSLLERAIATGFKPASDQHDDLMRLSQVKVQDQGLLMGDLRAYEAKNGKLIGKKRHNYQYKQLLELAQTLEQVRFDNQVNSEKAHAAGKGNGKGKGKDKKHGKKRGRGQKANTGDENTNSPPAKKKPVVTTTTTDDNDTVLTADQKQIQKLKNQNENLTNQCNNLKGKKGGGGKGSSNYQGWNQNSWNSWGNSGGKGKGKGKGKKGKGKGKGKKGTYDSSAPPLLPPTGWHPDIDWRCASCNAFNYKSRTTCISCAKPKSAAKSE